MEAFLLTQVFTRNLLEQKYHRNHDPVKPWQPAWSSGQLHTFEVLRVINESRLKQLTNVETCVLSEYQRY